MQQSASIALLLSVALICIGSGPSFAIFGGPLVEIPGDALATGNPLDGFGFAALRADDKKRLKRLRERYLEMNPRNAPNIKIYDIDTPVPEIVLAPE